ncbi:MAG: hypothetical protein ACE5Q6_19720 [Dehalococcoidia bacterium]
MTVPNHALPCLVCNTQLEIRLAKGRKSQKPFLMVICPSDGRHFRGFVGDRDFVQKVADAAGATPEIVAPSTSRG